MSDPKYHDRHTAGIYRAIALRFYCRYVDMRQSAEHVGGDITAHGKLPTALDAADQYWLPSTNGCGKPLNQQRRRSPLLSWPVSLPAIASWVRCCAIR